MNKQFNSYIQAYDYGKQRDWNSVKDCYGRPSQTKINIENDIKKEMEKIDGYGYHVCTRNGWMFTCGYLYKDSFGCERLIYHTPTHKYEIPYNINVN